MFFFNGAVIVSQTVTTYLGRPYGTCSSYGHNSDISSDHCLRKCYQHQCYQHLHCSPIFFRNFSSQYDWRPENGKQCNESQALRCETLSTETRFVELCSKQCPKDCLNIEFKHRIVENHFANTPKHVSIHNFYAPMTEIPIYWDSTVPDIHLVEVPSFSMINLLIQFGGLLALFNYFYIKQLVTTVHNYIKERRATTKIHPIDLTMQNGI